MWITVCMCGLRLRRFVISSLGPLCHIPYSASLVGVRPSARATGRRTGRRQALHKYTDTDVYHRETDLRLTEAPRLRCRLLQKALRIDVGDLVRACGRTRACECVCCSRVSLCGMCNMASLACVVVCVHVRAAGPP